MNLFLHPYSPNKMFSTESFGKILLFTKLPRVTAPSLLPDNIDRRARHREQEFLILSSCRNSAARPQSTRSFSLSPPPSRAGGGEGGALFISPRDFYRVPSEPSAQPVHLSVRNNGHRCPRARQQSRGKVQRPSVTSAPRICATRSALYNATRWTRTSICHRVGSALKRGEKRGARRGKPRA